MIDLRRFEALVRSAHAATEATPDEDRQEHPFELRDIHPDLPQRARELYDDGYFAEATFEAFKCLEREVKRATSLAGPGSP